MCSSDLSANCSIKRREFIWGEASKLIDFDLIEKSVLTVSLEELVETYPKILKGIITRSFGRGIETPNLKPTGSSEVRGLIRDFNNMQNNINSTIDNQRNMLAGISHDLKTPLTRINLMIEELNDLDLKDSISKNISDMNIMLNHYLDFIKNEKNENLYELETKKFIEELNNNYTKFKRFLAG